MGLGFRPQTSRPVNSVKIRDPCRLGMMRDEAFTVSVITTPRCSIAGSGIIYPDRLGEAHTRGGPGTGGGTRVPPMRRGLDAPNPPHRRAGTGSLHAPVGGLVACRRGLRFRGRRRRAPRSNGRIAPSMPHSSSQPEAPIPLPPQHTTVKLPTPETFPQTLPRRAPRKLRAYDDRRRLVHVGSWGAAELRRRGGMRTVIESCTALHDPALVYHPTEKNVVMEGPEKTMARAKAEEILGSLPTAVRQSARCRARTEVPLRGSWEGCSWRCR